VSCSLLDGEVVRGKHPSLIDEETFMKANNIHKTNPRSGVARKHKVNELSLKVFTKDAATQNPLTGYLHKQKDIYYYKARGLGSCVNVAARKLNDLFIEELKKFEYEKQHKKRIIELLTQKIKDRLKENNTNQTANIRRISELKNIIENLEERYVLNEISKDQYEKFCKKYKSEKMILEEENSKSAVLSSNLEKAKKKHCQSLKT